MNSAAILAEFRASLPEIIEGRDPIAFRPPDFYLARLRRYGADCAVPERPERGARENEGQAFKALARLKPALCNRVNHPDSFNRRPSDVSECSDEEIGNVRKAIGEIQKDDFHS